MTSILKRMIEAGCPVDIIAEVAEMQCRIASLEALEVEKQRAREKWAALKRAQRSRSVPMSTGRPLDKVALSISKKVSKKEVVSIEGGAPSAPRGSRLPPHWHPGTEGFEFAEKLVGTERSRQELDKFVDYWAGAAGQKARKLDWPATWRNWVRRAAETKNGVHHEVKPGSFQDMKERTRNGLQRLKEDVNSRSEEAIHAPPSWLSIPHDR